MGPSRRSRIRIEEPLATGGTRLLAEQRAPGFVFAAGAGLGVRLW